ncbi:GNAT family N-acetyltransferase [Aphanothece sacrum]|uniref:Acetyltransferase n=1 Tax=Aphanothece sacrum FPU1 TaxID=1920663 RepID=A0A401IIC4_APHSA|nr:GNAT family N-acetyltransferase [Aphanothece sacrum]GBF80989.1 acetyltransferase [Aphanothece sacrum FPU1]GBF85296.1 acetyltransferase [Aphanothece sacrum FPU3]
MLEIITPRLILRRWQTEDQQTFSQINADPRVMEFLPKPLSFDESNSFIERIETHFEENGFGLWATQLQDSPSLIGFIGLSIPRFQASFTPCVEIGWRLGYDYWGKGYATEGAKAALEFAFTQLNLPEVLSFTVPKNWRSRRVMERIDMKFSQEFDHPDLPEGNPLRKHILYKTTNPHQF